MISIACIYIFKSFVRKKINFFLLHNSPLEEDNYGRFRSGESYVVLLTFLKKNKECHVIFFYQGLLLEIILISKI